MNRYRALFAHESYAKGDEVELDLSEVDEAWYVDRGFLEVVPRRYKVVGPHAVHGIPPGDTFVRAMRLGEEAALVAGGHIARVGGPLPDEPDPVPDPEPKPIRRKPAPKE